METFIDVLCISGASYTLPFYFLPRSPLSPSGCEPIVLSIICILAEKWVKKLEIINLKC